MELWEERLVTPVGEITLVTDGQSLCSLSFEGRSEERNRYLQKCFGSHTLRPLNKRSQACKTIHSYFRGDFRSIHGLSLAVKGTDFQESVWRALCAIEPGMTQSYGDIARSIGNPKACRAVGMANRSNPIALVVPCHRVIGANGSLTGFAGGMDRKQWLLQHERKWA